VDRPNDVREINYRLSPLVSNDDLNRLFGVSWPNHSPSDFQKVLQRSLAYVCAYDGDDLVGFVYLAWDGGAHAFLLDPTVDPAFRRRGIGRRLVEKAVAVARSRGLEWVHVDYEPELEGFYRGCGFRPTLAGLIRLDERDA
jgi:GNAT superfamily N-acetyltransferase